MRSIDIANLFIIRHGGSIWPTNLSLNKLVYLSQVESLRCTDGTPLFSDAIEAWDYGPVEPAVYHSFKGYGRATIDRPSASGMLNVSDFHGGAVDIVDGVAEKYGRLTPFDLVNITHRPGGAWRSRYVRGQNNEIRINDIMESCDYRLEPDLEDTLIACVIAAKRKWPNALRMLEDS